MSEPGDPTYNYAKGPGQRALDGQVSHNRRAKASASPKAAPRGRSLTTLGALAGPTISDMSLAQTAGFSDRTTAASITSSAVTSGKQTIAPSSPFSESGQLGHDAVSESYNHSGLYTGTSRQGLKSRNDVGLFWRIDWLRIAGLMALASPWLMAALIAHLMGAF